MRRGQIDRDSAAGRLAPSVCRVVPGSLTKIGAASLAGQQQIAVRQQLRLSGSVIGSGWLVCPVRRWCRYRRSSERGWSAAFPNGAWPFKSSTITGSPGLAGLVSNYIEITEGRGYYARSPSGTCGQQNSI
jgi:hypothetical protein